MTPTGAPAPQGSTIDQRVAALFHGVQTAPQPPPQPLPQANFEAHLAALNSRVVETEKMTQIIAQCLPQNRALDERIVLVEDRLIPLEKRDKRWEELSK